MTYTVSQTSDTHTHTQEKKERKEKKNKTKQQQNLNHAEQMAHAAMCLSVRCVDSVQIRSTHILKWAILALGRQRWVGPSAALLHESSLIRELQLQ